MRRAESGNIKTSAINDAMTLLNADTSAKASAVTVWAGIFTKNAALNATDCSFAAMFAQAPAQLNVGRAKLIAKTGAFIPIVRKNALNHARLVANNANGNAST
jgi:hypothetical protein